MGKLQGRLFSLSDIPLEMRQYFEEVEVQCGAPWKRVVKIVGQVKQKWGTSIRPEYAVGPMDRGGHSQAETGGIATGMINVKETIDWRPTCTCGAEHPISQEELDADPTLLDDFEIEPYPPVPCTILDPFSGAGTTGLVADRLGRDAILIDLNPDYCQMAYERIKGENPMFTEVTLE